MVSISKLSTASLLIGIVICYGFQCKKDLCEGPVYFFEAPFTVTPNTDSIRLGDTLFVESNIPFSSLDSQRNQVIDFSNANKLDGSVYFLKLLGNNNVQAVGDSINFKVYTGDLVKSSSPDYVRHFYYTAVGDHYRFKLALSPKNRGTYAIIFTSINGRRDQNCEYGQYRVKFVNTDPHQSYYLQNSPGAPLNPGTYCFKVY